MYSDRRSNNHKLNHIVTNTDLIFTTKLELPNELQTEINNLDLPKLGNQVTYDDYNFIEPLQKFCVTEFQKNDKDGIFQKVIRILLSQVPKNHVREDGIHRDSDALNHWSFLIHLRGDSGPTVFYDSLITTNLCKQVPFEPYTLIIFPSLYPHDGLVSTTVTRYTINYIMQVDSKLNQHILANSPRSLINEVL